MPWRKQSDDTHTSKDEMKMVEERAHCEEAVLLRQTIFFISVTNKHFFGCQSAHFHSMFSITIYVDAFKAMNISIVH